MYFSMNHEGRRHKWTVKVAATILVSACAERMAYHTDRLKFWEEEHNKADERLRKEGVKFENQPVSGGNRLQTKLDPAMAERVTECEASLRKHRGDVDHFWAYQAFFRAALDADGKAEFDLCADDVLYFNLKAADTDAAPQITTRAGTL